MLETGVILTVISIILSVVSLIKIFISKTRSVRNKLSQIKYKELNYKKRKYIFGDRKARNRKIDQQLVDTINLLSNGLKAGLSFLQVVERIGRETKPPVSTEFNQMLKKIRLGMPLASALKELGRNMNNPNFDLVITAILIHRQTGGNLAEVLDKISGTIRDRISLKREIEIKTVQGRLSGNILTILPSSLVIIIAIINPGYLYNLFVEPIGIFIFIFAVILQFAGIYLTRRIMNIDL